MNRKRLPLIVSFILGVLAFPVAVFTYFVFGHPPVTVADVPFPLEGKVVKVPLLARIDREMLPQSPVPMNDSALSAGAQVYREQCASCHGLKDHPSRFAAYTYPRTPQLWAAHKNNSGVVGVSDDPVVETYWKVKNGIRLSGMPSYAKILSEEKMWQVSLLLSSAAKSLPPEAVKAVSDPLPQ